MAKYYVNSNMVDQGAARDEDDFTCGPESLKEIIDFIGTTNDAIIICEARKVGVTTYTLTTSETVPSNIQLVIENGAVFDGAGTLTINGTLDAGSYQIFGDSITVVMEGSTIIDILPQWFNSDPYTNGFESIRAAMRAASSGGDSNRSVYIPAGDYIIDTTGVFSDLDSTANIGIKVRGAGWNSTRLLLSPSGSDLWFYNNVTTERLQFPVFEDIGFFGKFSPWTYATTSNYAKGFRIYSGAATGNHEQGFKFLNCNFIALHTVLQTAGDNTASETTFINCRINHIKNVVLELNNTQSFNHSFINTDVEVIWGDSIRVGTVGGGAVKVYGGSWIANSDSGVDEYIVDVPAASAIGSHFSIFTFNGVRFELTGDYSKLVNSDGVSGELDVVFRDCMFWSATATGPKTDWVTISNYKNVTFDRCNFAWDDAANYEGYTLNSAANFGQPGSIRWRNCQVHEDLSEHITFTNDYGRVISEGCSQNLVGPRVVEPWMLATDFELFGMTGLNDTNFIAGNVDNNFKIKTVNIMFQSWWPFNNSNEATVKLPSGALIKAIKVNKPAQSASGVDYCLHVSNDDKSTIYASSVPEYEKVTHRIDYERGSSSTAQLTTRTDNDTGTFTFRGGNHSISTADTVTVYWIEVAGGIGTRWTMTVSSITTTTRGRTTITLDGGDGDALPAANTECTIESTAGMIEVGSTDNERIVRLWSSDGDGSTASGAGGHAGGYAIVEYY